MTDINSVYRWAIVGLTVITVVAILAECRKSENTHHANRQKEQAQARESCVANGGSVIEAAGGKFHCVMLRGER